MLSRLTEAVELWCDARSIVESRRPNSAQLAINFANWGDPTRPPIELADITDWERRHSYSLPQGLREWLRLSNGFQLAGPVIHPLAGIGPMVPFATMPNVVVQPESWFELGNPNVETVCFDLAYKWPGGDFPLFTSGDDLTDSRPRIIATGFDDWFLGLLHAGGSEFWFDRNFISLGDPWLEHRRHVPLPALNDHLKALAPAVENLLREQRDERTIAERLGVSSFDIEAIARFLQHHQPLGD